MILYLYRKVGDMSSGAMDEYMKFCGRLLKTKAVGGWFAMEDDVELELEEEEEEEELEEIRGVGCGILGEEENSGLPGSSYNIWNGRDVCGIADKDYENVLCLGGTAVGVPVEYLGMVIGSYERRLMAVAECTN